MTQTFVYQALVQAVSRVPGMIPFSTPFLKFTPPTGGAPYADLSIVWNPPEPFTLGDDGEDMLTGFLQITLNYPLDKGIFAPSRLCDLLRKHFKAGSRLSYTDLATFELDFVKDSYQIDPPQEVIIKSSGSGQFSNFEGKLVNPFTIYFYALIKR